MYSELEKTVLFLIDQTSKTARQYSQKQFDLLGINVSVEQWVLLKVIEREQTLSQSELAKITHRDPASIGRSLDLLEKKGLIKRKIVANNRRKHNLTLTKEGDYFILQNMPLVNKLRNTSLKGFSEQEITDLMDKLNRIQRNMATL